MSPQRRRGERPRPPVRLQSTIRQDLLFTYRVPSTRTELPMPGTRVYLP